MIERCLLAPFARIIAASEARILRALANHFYHQENHLSQLDDAIASAAANVATLNTKVDAALAALAASVANQTPVTQAELDAIAAIGVAADTEAAKVDAALTPPAAPAAQG